MSTLLAYSISTNPFPIQASLPGGNPNVAQMTIVATNNSGNDVKLQGMMVQIPIGQGATQLTNDDPDISPVPPTDWILKNTLHPTGYVQYEFLPSSGSATLPNNSSLDFIFNQIEINSQTGEVEIDVTEGSNNCTPGVDCPVKSLYVTKFPDGWGNVTFNVNPPDIPYGGSTVLTWSGPAGAAYTIEYYTPQTGIVNIPAQGDPPLGNQGQYPAQGAPPLTLTQTTVFTLQVEDTISGQTYEAQDQKTVTVELPVLTITHFTGFLQQGSGGLEVVLNWQTNADKCTMSGDSHTLNPSSMDNSYKIFPSNQVPLLPQYTLTATNGAGNATSTLTVIWGIANSIGIDSPTGVALSPDNTKVYVAMNNAGTVVELQAANLQQVGSPVGVGVHPEPVVISQDGTRLYVSNDVSYSVSALDATTSPPTKLGQDAKVGPEPMYLTITPDGKHLFASNVDNGTVSVLATSTDPNNPLSVVTTISLGVSGGMATGIAVSPDGSRVYAGAVGQNVTTSVITVIDAVKFSIIGQSPALGDAPVAIAVTPDSSHVLAAVGQNGINLSVMVFKVTTDPSNPLQLVGSFPNPGGNSPQGLALSPDGSCMYLVTEDNNLNGIVTVADISSLSAIGTSISFGLLPLYIAVSGDGSKIFVTTGRDNKLWLLVPVSLTGGV